MHLTIGLSSDYNIVLPVYYNRAVQEFAYSILSSDSLSRPDEKGCKSPSKFNLFACSLSSGNSESNRNYINFGNSVKFEFSSPFGDICTFTKGLCRKQLFLGSNPVRITSLSIECQEVTTDNIVVKTLSPVMVYSTLRKARNQKHTYYYQPGEPDFQRICNEILRTKYTAYTSTKAPNDIVQITPLTQPELHIYQSGGNLIKSYSSMLGLTGPRVLLQTAVDCGLGRDNTHAFGLIRMATN